jgi:hypothetical protein
LSGGEAFAWGLVGGLLPDLLTVIQAGNRETMPAQFKKPWWWVTFVISVVVGGLAALLLDPTQKLEAVAYGFGAPEILRRVLGAAGNRAGQPGTPALASAEGPSRVRDYLA